MLEEIYARDLDGDYNALQLHLEHHYCEVHAFGEMVSWLAYFIKGIASFFKAVVHVVRERSFTPKENSDKVLRKLDRRTRIVIGLFSNQESITANDVALSAR